MVRFFNLAATAIYVAAALALLALSAGFIAYAGWMIYLGASGARELLQALLHAIGLIIIALAGADVAKFLVEEEVARDKNMRQPSEVRRTLARFLTVIIIAASLEALVFTFEAGRERVEGLAYPALLFVAVALLVTALGFYQRMSRALEQAVRGDPEDDPASAASNRPEKPST